MKVTIGNYKSFFGPYQLAEFVCFWAKPKPDEHGILNKPDWVHDFGEWLAYGNIAPDPKPGEITELFKNDRNMTLLYKFLLWIDGFKTRKIKVRIDAWDTWSMDHTLSYIILPMLKQLKDKKQGSPWVDDSDVPEQLQSSNAPPKENEYDIDANHHLRWEYVLSEMIFAFENKLDDSWQDQFYQGTIDFNFKKLDNGMSELVRGPNDTSVIDHDGLKKYQDRISNGFRLFGKYYESLWT